MIEKLTKEQEIQLISFREEWRKHGLSCERIDKETSKNAWSAVAWTFKMNEKEYKPIIET